MGKWLAQFKEKNTPEVSTQGTVITDVTPTSETPASLYQAVADELTRDWLPGTRQDIEQQRPTLAREIDQAEAEVNRFWCAVNAGTGTMDAFKGALETWRQANLKAIRILADSQPLDMAGADPDEVDKARAQLRRQGYFLMHSHALGERIAVVEHDAGKRYVPPGMPAYILEEIRLLQQGVVAGTIVSIGDLRLLHEAKKSLGGAIVR